VELKGKQLNTVLAQNEYKKRHDIFAKIIHMNLAVKFNLLKNTQPHYSYTPESCLENDSYKLYFDRTILTAPLIEDRKAGRQISEMRRIPRPPNLIGKVD
jgi:hypothetical protein